MIYLKTFNTFKKITESFATKIYDLIRYFEKPIQEKIEELPEFFERNYPDNILIDWCSDNISYFTENVDDEEADIFIPDGVYALVQYPEAYKAYCEFLYEISSNIKDIFNNNPYNLKPHLLPLFITYSYEDDVKDGWLVHFTMELETVESIIEDGHFKGIPNVDNLTVTAGNEEEWVEDGYCFAFDISDSYYNFRDEYAKYGTNGVIFKSSGIKLFHAGDDEHQVVFIGNTATNMIGFHQDEKTGFFYTLDKKIIDKDFYKFIEKVLEQVI